MSKKKTFPVTITANVPERHVRDLAEYMQSVMYDEYLLDLDAKKILSRPGVEEAIRGWIKNSVEAYAQEFITDGDSYEVFNLENNDCMKFLNQVFASEIQGALEKIEREEEARPLQLSFSIPRDKKAEAVSLLKKLGGKIQ